MIIENGLVYEIQEENGKEIARYVNCSFLKLDIQCLEEVAVNTELDVALAYLDYKDKLQTNTENVTIEVTYDGKVIASKTITPLSGMANIIFEFAGPGEYTIVARGDCTCDSAVKKVMVSG